MKNPGFKNSILSNSYVLHFMSVMIKIEGFTFVEHVAINLPAGIYNRKYIRVVPIYKYKFLIHR